MPATHTIPIPVGPPSGTVFKNGIEQQAQILSRRQDQVYVHYVNQDKRMDEWIPETEFMPSATDSHHARKRKRSRQGDSEDESTPDDLSAEENGVERTMEVTEEDFDFEHHKKITAQRNFDKVHFGNWLIRTWYFSPYPLMENEESELVIGGSTAVNGHQTPQNGAGPSAVASPMPKIPGVRHTTARSHARVLDLLAGGLARTEKTLLWVCEFCFKYMTDPALYEIHRLKCTHTHPPGRKVYERGAHAIWEVDGAVQKLYCQNLSLFGKLFIDVKTLFFDCDNFLFYIMTTADSTKYDRVYGFFSKEKVSYDDYNLACIITLPPYQRKGFGMLMIEFSYELSRRKGKVGTPERPLSDLGLRSYLAYWVGTLIRFFRRVLQVLPPGASKITSKGNLPDLRSPSHELEDDGTPSVVNGNGTASATPSNGVKRKKRTKGWAGEVTDLSFLGAPADEDFREFRAFEMTANENGSATVDVVIRCTLRDIANATNLRVEDAAFALNEIGLLALRLSSEDTDEVRKTIQAELDAGANSAPADNSNKFVFISRAMVERVADDRNVKPPCMDVQYVLIGN
ncbi:acyl-CoA N-acyltransferase [Mycena albidolilacea]|uniref:histone acetyltransferase n=1 Tax=Mycena albidolilacea TaxID=1033008 RepID=A0AAD7AN15_9AGAR|nr:acyl-CoA N-acyltransferase [Mycena albidolilacea]